MLIINADDLGRDREATDTILECYRKGRITSASAMVFMEDSQRAADLAKTAGLGLEIGLHLNLTEEFTGADCPAQVSKSHESIRRFLKPKKRTQILYHPFLRKHFRCVVAAQFQEFSRLFGRPPSHLDGHQHMHLGTNVLVDKLIPPGHNVRRNFSCLPGENPGGLLKRTYLRAVDRFLARNYKLTDCFFGLSDRRHKWVEKERIARVFRLSNTASVELMVHPAKPWEREYLLSEEVARLLASVSLGRHRALTKS